MLLQHPTEKLPQNDKKKNHLTLSINKVSLIMYTFNLLLVLGIGVWAVLLWIAFLLQSDAV